MSSIDIYGPLDFQNPILFDLDYTLIRPKSGYKFPRYAADFEFMPNVLNKLRNITQPIVIISNQGGTNKKLINARIKLVHEELIKTCENTTITIFVAHKYDKYRKPNTGIWDEYISSKCVKTPLYIGDALGRNGDFSNSDLLFAKNIGATIMSPEQYFE